MATKVVPDQQKRSTTPLIERELPLATADKVDGLGLGQHYRERLGGTPAPICGPTPDGPNEEDLASFGLTADDFYGPDTEDLTNFGLTAEDFA